MSPARWSTTGLIARRELRERSRAKSFWVTTVLLVLAVAGGVVIPALVNGRPGVEQVAVIGGGTAAVKAVQEAGRVTGTPVHVESTSSLGAAEAGLRSGRLAAVMVSRREVLLARGIAPGATSSTARFADALAQLGGLQRLLAQLPAGAGASFAHGVALPVRGLEPAPHLAATRFTGLVASIMIYVLILFYGIRIAVGVGEEKASRVVEVLLATVRPSQLLVGKVAGIGALAVAQVAAMVATALVAGVAVDSSLLHGASLGVLGIAAVWFVVGYAFYCSAFAAAGSLINRQADTYNATLPLQIPLILAYLTSFSVVFGKANPLDRVLAFLPPTAPISMTALYAAGDAPLWQLLVSLALCLVATVALTRLAAVIYERAILRTGGRVRLRQVLRPQST